jgi:hypothetical protein
MIEYKVREVTRYIVTRFYDFPDDYANSKGSKVLGEFANEDQAYEVADALAFKEREDLGWPPGDERIQFADRYRKPAN